MLSAPKKLRVEDRPPPKRAVMAGRSKPPPLTGKQHVKIARLEPVGNYAVRIVFDDGHDTGLYSWDYLAELGPRVMKKNRSRPPKKRRVSNLPRSPLRSRAPPSSRARMPGRFTDFYHGVLTSGWPVFILQLALLFVAVNIIFAGLRHPARSRRHRQCQDRRLHRCFLLQRADFGRRRRRHGAQGFLH